MSHENYFDEPVALRAKIICSFPITLNVFQHCLVSSGKLGLKKNWLAYQKVSSVNIRHRKLSGSLVRHMPQEHAWR